MAALRWRLEGRWVKSCNCAPGCPCDFWAPPTHRACLGLFAMKVDRGHFGPTRLDGVKFGLVLSFPGPLHEGHGTVVPFIDDKARPAQREAVLAIMSGKAGNALFEVMSSLVTTRHAPHFAPVRFEHDLKKRKARVSVEGLLETVTEPLRNLATGGVHAARVELPDGGEYKRAEIAAARIKATGPIGFEVSGGHSSLAHVVQTERGLLR